MDGDFNGVNLVSFAVGYAPWMLTVGFCDLFLQYLWPAGPLSRRTFKTLQSNNQPNFISKGNNEPCLENIELA